MNTNSNNIVNINPVKDDKPVKDAGNIALYVTLQKIRNKIGPNSSKAVEVFFGDEDVSTMPPAIAKVLNEQGRTVIDVSDVIIMLEEVMVYSARMGVNSRIRDIYDSLIDYIESALNETKGHCEELLSVIESPIIDIKDGQEIANLPDEDDPSIV